ncbi:hypothetical protein CIK75_02125 [Glutamicibacter sp. BW78]|uniref:hypothetical protein n=1 Tax=Glutamicibacter sp. BW78 TaxID=2024403 RepID=UPI000BB69EB5|nr:hypothetical protein [Glutamicibacter sp. BW78]PCC26637.1 hypothetical protein CIK75_02125 [Glutamicibacter sp. BW78]
MTTTTSTRRVVSLAALALAAPLFLSSCGTSGDATGESASDRPNDAKEAVYEFGQPTYVSVDGGPLEVRVPEALKEVAGADLEGLAVTSMTLTPHELESAGSCAVDLDVEFVDNGKDSLQTAGQTEDEYVKAAKESFDDDLGEGLQTIGIRTWDELVAEMGQEKAYTIMSEFAPVAPDGTFDDEVARASYDGGTPRGKVLKALGLPDDSPSIDALDESDPETDVYASDDASDITIVQDCAASSSNEEDAGESIKFPLLDEDENRGFDDGATFEFAVMKSGELGIVNGRVIGYETDTNGDWIAG